MRVGMVGSNCIGSLLRLSLIRARRDDGVAVDAFAALVPPRFIRVRKDDGGRWVTNIIRNDGDHS